MRGPELKKKKKLKKTLEERSLMFVDMQNKLSNGHITKYNTQIHYNPHQNSNDIINKNRKQS
jgi:hypothetical protein